jgi:carboxylesterase
MIRLSNQPFLLEQPQGDRACLLLHGLGGGVYEMQLLGEFLYGQGWTVQGINYPGHDLPAAKMPASTWQQWFEHSLKTYQQLSQRYGAIDVIGFSTGCLLALNLADVQRVRRLALLAPYLAIKRHWYYLLPPEAYLLSIGQLIEDLPRFRVPIRDRAMRAAAEQVIFFKTFNLQAVRSASQLIDHVKTRVAAIQTSTLIMQSYQDSVVEPWGAQFLQEHLGSTVKQLQWLQQSDHVIPLDVERQQVFASVGQFLGGNADGYSD